VKVQVVSDLHTESRRDALAALPGWRDPEASTLIIAGDACNWKSGRQMDALLKAVSEWDHVLYVPGNHEYYDGDPGSCTLNAIDAFLNTNVQVAYSPGYVQIGVHRFLLGTMWFTRESVAALDGSHPETGSWSEGGRRYQFSDFHYTRGLGSWCYDQNQVFRNCMRFAVAPDVVVTHHLPSNQSVPAQFKSKPDNCFYVCDVEAQIRTVKPKLWIHGHTHSSMDYQIDSTRIVANPLGYTRERAIGDYRPLTLELP
jgi:predicted phosphodiesterase